MKKNIKFVLGVFFLAMSLIAVQNLKKHVVIEGDTLWDIAGAYYDNPFLWPVIYKANQDSISDPHWIYPGEVFVIPDIPAEVTTLPPAEAEIVITKGDVKVAKPSVARKPAIRRKKYTPTAEIELFSVVKAKEYVFTHKAAFLAGFISDNKNLPSGNIIKVYSTSGEPEIEAIIGEKVDINKGTSDGIGKGDIYTIFEWGKGVKGYGKIVRIKGILEVIKAGSKVSEGILLETYESIKKGDYLMDYISPTAREGEVKPTVFDLEGKIIAFKEDEFVIKPYSIVYIEPGEGEVKPGDFFLVYQLRKGSKSEEAAPITPLGMVQIVYVKGKSASGYITSLMGNLSLKVGDRIRLVGRIEG